jgi:nijmegen breakage syndrome protein 1
MDPPPVEESQGLFVSQDPEMEVDYPEPEPRKAQTRSSRKRATPPVEYDDEEEDFMDQLAPAAAALKKRRMAEQTERRRRGEVSPPTETIEESPEPSSPPKTMKKEIDILELARTQREKAEELARKEREALQESLNGMDIEAIRSLAIIEEMEISRQPPPQRASREDESDRWDDRWNGRKNFKKFRRRGEAGSRPRDFQRVIVPLEEVKKKDFGIGDDYWLETDNQRRKKKDKGQDGQDVFSSQSQPRPKTGASTRAAEILADELEDLEEADARDLLSSDVEIVEQPPEPAAAMRSQKSQRPGTSMPQKPPAANKKRPAANSLAKPAPAKRARQAATRRKDESDDSDDEHRFRFRSRK